MQHFLKANRDVSNHILLGYANKYIVFEHYFCKLWVKWPSPKKKKVIWEKTYFLEGSKIWDLIKPKRNDKRKKWD